MTDETKPITLPIVEEILRREVPRGPLAQFRDGFCAPLDGFRMMNAYPFGELWRYSILPAIASVLVTAFVVMLLLAIIITSSGYVHEQFDATWAGRAMEFAVFALIVVFALAASFIVWLLMLAVTCSFFFTKLVTRVELRIGTSSEELCEATFREQVIDDVVDVAKLVLICIGMLLLNSVPLIGTLCYAVGSTTCNCLFAGYSFFDYPLLVRGMRRAQRRQIARQHVWHTLGLGAAVLAMLLVPVVGSALLSTAVTGSALMCKRLGVGSGQGPGLSATPSRLREAQTR